MQTTSNGHIQPTPISADDELARVNREMYERNIELAVRNRTLSVLRKMYDIINTSLGVEETAQKLIDAIVSELRFKKGFIALVNRESRMLKTIAVSHGLQNLDELLDHYKRPFSSFEVSLREDDNHCVKSILYKKRRMTNMLSDIFSPHIDEKTANIIQERLAIQTCMIYPIIFGGTVLGVLAICLDKHVGDLSRAERETLNELIEVVGIAIERTQIYADLKNANEQLKQLDKLKDEFVSLASHELRTPMTAIKSYLWMALSGRGGELTEKQKYYLERSYSSTTRLIKLVNDMLNVSRIESGRVTIEVGDVDLYKLTQDVIGEVKPRADELKLNLEIGPAPPNLPHVLADADKIKEVLVNLIGNSMKFTPEQGTIHISYEVRDGMVHTRVRDTGVGLSKENLSKLFQKFSLIKDSYKTNKGDTSQGTGLGLYICKSIIAMHGGHIWAESAGEGKGSTISFTLKPYSPTEAQSLNQQHADKPKLGIAHNEIG